MLELAQLAPMLAPSLFIVAAIMLGLREMRKMTGNGKFDELAKRMDGFEGKVDKRIDGLEGKVDNVVSDVSYIRGKLDASAEDTGRHLAVAEPGE